MSVLSSRHIRPPFYSTSVSPCCSVIFAASSSRYIHLSIFFSSSFSAFSPFPSISWFSFTKSRADAWISSSSPCDPLLQSRHICLDGLVIFLLFIGKFQLLAARGSSALFLWGPQASRPPGLSSFRFSLRGLTGCITVNPPSY